MNARAALDAARAVFEPSLGRSLSEATATPVWRETTAAHARPRTRAVAMWHAAEHVLQSVLGRPELTGQALVSEARRQQFLTLGDGHALVALQGWVDRVQEAADTDVDAPPNDGERSVAREAWMALEHAVERPTAAPAAPAAAAAATPMASSTPTSTAKGADAWQAAGAVTARKWYATTGFVTGAVSLLLVAGAGGWILWQKNAGRDYEEGISAYERGAREVARSSFARFAQDHTDDARPLVYLGRIAREERDLARARRFLEAAVRLDPSNAAAQRELAAALLADGQPELARRFYVRAIELNPADRLSQGFLACALHRVGRFEEAKRWADRAGPGEWIPCLSTPVLLPPPAPATPPP